MRAATIALFILIAPAFAKTPLPNMKPCVPIDDTNVTSVIRIVRYVAKTDYVAPDARKKKIQDRLPTEPETKGSHR